MAGDPALLIVDGPTTALDVTTQAQALNLLADSQQRRGPAYLFITHSLAAVRYISHRVAVIYLGGIFEIAPARTFFDRPRHPNAEALVYAVPA